ncbi:oligogalacturonate-specific porin KdgM family protein [Vibrio hippocampi]|uniref:Oligogalacturonate-specific porin KdgM n=1 Tax=Vibrio hippocampi TaxID=654686 RepID=A0ABN8DLM1_9VIBR|nr:oligogalacturonate-specific porin KdgM family protein [Vibrio hippocampi]CAH0526750.1 Oligogalacturonate-specific porin KdgM [Vibrio hippocampi]
MNKISKVAVATATLIAATSASAVSIDFRQEYRNEQDQYNSRFKMAGSVDNHYFGLEIKQTGKPFSEIEWADNEFEYGYKFKVTKKFTVTPSMPITFGEKKTTYKPQVRVQYKFNNLITTKLRYRHEFGVCAESVEEKCFTYRDGTTKADNANRSKLTANISGKWNSFFYDVEANYAEDFFNSDYKMGTNGEYDWDYNFKLGYNFKEWNLSPYMELGNIGCSSSSCGDDQGGRQLRSRVGIKYSF